MITLAKKSNQKSVVITQYELEGDLCVPTGAKAIILFAHGTGSSRYSTRNQYVSHALNEAGFATLLVDLLSISEKETDSRTRHLRFDIQLLSRRIISVTEWLKREPPTRSLPIGYFGSSTGAAAALIAASKFDNIIEAIVSRGGRLDLAEEYLRKVVAPTLLIVGGDDRAIVPANNRALNELEHAKAKELVLIPGAGHLFEEPGKMEAVVEVAKNWFEYYVLRSGKLFVNKYEQKASRLPALFKIKDMLQIKFKDRGAAGEMLALLLGKYKSDLPIVIGIPRGGLVVADTVARKLSADFDIIIPRRLRTPDNSEIAIGALMQDGSVYLDKYLIESLRISDEYLEAEKLEQKKEIDRRLSLYRPEEKEYEIKGKIIILVDDGAATGSTIIAAARWIKKHNPNKLVIVLPVAPKEIADALKHEADQVEILKIAKSFGSVSDFYADYRPLTDDQVTRLINNNRHLSTKTD